MVKKVLFLCTGNAARSQMAEALLRHYGGDSFDVYSAGFEPRGIHPLTVQVLAEAGIDLGDQYSKSVKEFMGRMRFDDVIIVCRRAEENCPSISADAARTHRWLFDDPAAFAGSDAEKLAKFRDVRDQIEARLKLWLAEMAEAEGV